MPGRAAPPRTRVPLLERVVDLGSAASTPCSLHAGPVKKVRFAWWMTARFFLSGLVASGVKPPEV